MAAAPIPTDGARVERLLGRVNELAVLPHVIYKVLELSGTADSSMNEIERAIVVDPGFSSRLLAMANSAYYALPKKVTSIREAIMFLGFKTIRQIAMTVGMYDMFVGKTDKESLRRRAWWRHSIDTAVCCRWLGKETRRVPPDEAYTCGLLHYIGKTLLDRFGGEDYELVEALAAQGIPTMFAEQEIYGCDHMDVALAAATKWGFPDSLLCALPYEHEPDADDLFSANRACVAVASRITTWAVESQTHEIAEERRFPSWAIAGLGIPEEREAEFVERGIQAIAEAASMQV
jgi:HD-like signal output (HDOD) protein